MPKSILTPMGALREFVRAERNYASARREYASRLKGDEWHREGGARDALDSVLDELDRLEAAAKEPK